jgi:hypothetical protein
MRNGSVQPGGALLLRKIAAPPKRPVITTMADALKYGGGLKAHPELTRRGMTFLRAGKRALAERVMWQERNSENFERSLAAASAAEQAALGGAVAIIGNLWLAKIDRAGVQHDLGLASCRVVTTAGVNYVIDAFQNLVELENMKYHGVGTGAAAEAVGNTALTTELTTQYSVASTRPTGTTGEQAGNANVYETVATITVSSPVALTEHGIFSQAAVAGGTMLDRTTFAAVNLASSESLQATYQFTMVAGS